MRKLVSTLVVAAALVTLSGALAAAADLLVTGEIPYAFSAAGNKLPAGKYEVLRENPQTNVLVLRDFAAKKTVLVPYLTRLAPTQDENAELVFDKDANGTYLSEVRIPGVDGYFVTGAPGEHSHVRVKASKAAAAAPKK
jgi:hypothetical protein